MTSDRLGEDVCEVSVNEIHQEPSQITMILVLCEVESSKT